MANMLSSFSPRQWRDAIVAKTMRERVRDR
jgi:hypothetical protein